MRTIREDTALDKGDVENNFVGDASVAVEFLRALDPTGWHNLVAIHPETRAVEAKTFGPRQWDSAREWIKQRNGGSNLYFTLNEVAAGTPDKKAGKRDIVRVRAIAADLDPKERDRSGYDAERARLAGTVDELASHETDAPTFIVDSGNGYQAIWKLADPADARTAGRRVEAIGAGAAAALGGDPIQNIDRVLRLPGTINLPDARKRAKGRVPTLARLTHSTDRTHCLDDFERWAAPAPSRKRTENAEGVDVDMDAVESVTHFGDIPEETRRRFSELQKRDPSVAGLWGGDRSARPGGDDSRSGFSFALASILRKSGEFNPTEFGMLLRVWDLDDLEPFDVTRRTISRDWSRCDARAANEEFGAVEVTDGRITTAPLPVRNVLSGSVSRYQNYLVKGLLNFGMVGLCVGAKNTGKSPLLLDIAAHIVKGEPWLGHRVQPAYVLYVATEGWTGIGNRLEAVRQEYFGGAEVAALDYLATPLKMRTSRKDTHALIQTVNDRAAHFGRTPGLVIVDTLSHVLEGKDDSDQEATKPVIANAKVLAGATGAAVLFAHHPSKTGGVRGTSTLEDDTDLTIYLTQDAKSERRRMTTPRVKDYGEIDPVAFDIKEIHLGRDQDGDEITSVVVSWRPDAQSEFEPKLTGAQEDALETLTGLLEKATSVSQSDWRRAFQEVRKASGHSASAKSTFTDAVRKLSEMGLVAKSKENQYVIGSGPEGPEQVRYPPRDQGESGPFGSPCLQDRGNRTGHTRHGTKCAARAGADPARGRRRRPARAAAGTPPSPRALRTSVPSLEDLLA